MIELLHKDCMELLKDTSDKFYDLAIVDPPYGLGDRLVDGGTKKNPMQKYRKDYEEKRWDVVPNKEYFDELFRVSKNQIIWGGNYFLEHLHSTRGIICWDKKQMMETLSRWEFGWTSFDKVAKTYEIRSQDLNRIHINQKPIELYEWLLLNYAKENDNILDTHGGSMSIALAVHNVNQKEQMNLSLTLTELDEDYYKAGVKRYENHIKQKTIFDL